MKSIATLFLCCALMLACVFTLGGCAKKPATPGAPAATTLDKLSASAYEIANALDSGEKEFEALYTSNIPGVSDDSYAKTVATMFLSAQSCNSEYIAELKSLVTVDDSNRAQVAGWSSTFVSCVNTLINNGVVGIKNPDARQKIQNLLAPVPAAIKLIVDALGLASTSVARPCEGACAVFYFTEVNDARTNTRSRSAVHRAGASVGGIRARILQASQASGWPYRSTAPGRCSQDQRRGCGQDKGVPFPSQHRGITKPLRDAWIYT